MKLTVNGQAYELPDDSSIASMVGDLELAATRIAVELNGVVVPKTDWDKVLLSEGDRLEVVHFVGGG